jgi:signal transduction histidine kinase/ActR/RegA family two-component response regulator
MDRLLERLWDYLARGKSTTLNVRLYRLICVMSAMLTLAVVLPVNLLQSLHPLVNVGDITLGLFSLICYRESCRGRDHILLFFIVLVLMLDPVWFLNGGSHGSIPYFFFAAPLYPLALCRGKTRWLLTLLLAVNITALLVVEYNFPSLTVPFQRPWDRLMDLITGAICSCLIISLFAWVIIANYDWEQKLVIRHSREMQRIQQLESVGVLAGGIAHDFNNLLTAILGNISLIKSSPTHNPEDFELLQDAEKACLQAKNLTSQLLTFSRGGTPVKTAVVLSTVIQDSTSLALRGSAVTCHFDLPQDLWLVEADAAQLSQVFNNLILNAQQAMPNGGRVFISAQNRSVSKVSHPMLAPGRYVQVTVWDEGTGIKAELLPKIFDPYFTTKRSGSGLGLAVVFSIVKHHLGTITVDSQFGAGTRFTLMLPATDQPLSTHAVNAGSPQNRICRILVMDDDEKVRNLLKRILQREGHTVETANDGAAAVVKYQQALGDSQPFDLVIMDLTIPGGMGGRETIERIKEIDPQVKAIVSSGYSESVVMADYKANGFQGVIPKPYDAAQLRSEIHKVLSQPPA